MSEAIEVVGWDGPELITLRSPSGPIDALRDAPAYLPDEVLDDGVERFGRLGGGGDLVSVFDLKGLAAPAFQAAQEALGAMRPQGEGDAGGELFQHPFVSAEAQGQVVDLGLKVVGAIHGTCVSCECAPSGGRESPVGETRPAADRAGGELTIDDLIAAMEGALPRLSAEARKGLLDLIDVRDQLFRVDAQPGPAGANHIRLSLQLSDAGLRLCAALRAGDFDVLSHWASPGLGLDPQSEEGESPAGAKRPATRSAGEPG